MIDSRDLNELLPEVRVLAEKFLAECRRQGMDVRISSTYRDYARQAALYAQGRTTPGKIVTYARPGDSWHNHRRAFDFFVVENGKAAWNDLKAFRKARSIGIALGLKGLSFELAHLEYHPGLTLAQAKAQANAAASA